MIRQSIVLAVLVSGVAALSATQGPAQQPGPAFEVSSVKPMIASAESAIGASFRIPPGGRFNAEGATVRDLVRWAYEVQDFQLEGGEDWTRRTRFDVTARAANERAPAREIRRMVQALLHQRFQLRVRRETRTVPVYELTVANRDGRLGAGLKKSSLDCTAVFDGRDTLDLSPVDEASRACQPAGKFTFGPTTIFAFERKGFTMPLLARLLTGFVRRAVIDKTGLDGSYDVALSFSPESVIYITQETGIREGGPPGDGLSVSSALRDQLGLRLESARGPGEVLVIESVERPTPD